MNRFFTCAASIMLLLLGACAQTGKEPYGPPVPKGVKIGTPYEMNGTWYHPRYDPSYDEVGMASWYGPDFHGKKTANGEIFDQDALTAAHPTLPLPSIVRVTNLKNNKAVNLRVNDRGPFSKKRIIDVSRRSAQELGFWREGTAKVRVQLLQEETLSLWQSLGQTQLAAVESPAESEAPIQVTKKLDNGDMSYSIQRAEKPAISAPVTSVSVQEALVTADAPPPPQQVMKPVPAISNYVPVSGVYTVTLPETLPEEGIQLASLNVPARTAESAPPEPPVVQAAARTSSMNREGIFLQAGAFSVEENARKLAQKLASVGEVHVDTTDSRGRTLYLVRLGPYDGAAEAEAAKGQVARTGHSDVRIIKN